MEIQLKERTKQNGRTIEQAHLIRKHGRHVYYSHRDTIKATHVYGLAKKHKQRNNAELQPNMIYTATLRQFYFSRLAPHTHLHKTQKKRKSRLPCAWSPSLATATPSPSGVVRELVPRIARLVRPTARTGFWGNGRGFPALPPRLLLPLPPLLSHAPLAVRYVLALIRASTMYTKKKTWKAA